tara:strand:+ start:5775 stop:5933 length:159 start_codon:yes stop_codon:yes gene_type:complete
MTDYNDEPDCTKRGTGWVDFKTLNRRVVKKLRIKRRKRNEKNISNRDRYTRL